jgi:hypothetical protein
MNCGIEGGMLQSRANAHNVPEPDTRIASTMYSCVKGLASLAASLAADQLLQVLTRHSV